MIDTSPDAISKYLDKNSDIISAEVQDVIWTLTKDLAESKTRFDMYEDYVLGMYHPEFGSEWYDMVRLLLL